MTGLSAADLVRAKRLRDGAQLEQRADLLHLLAVIEEMSAESSAEADEDLRQRLWKKLSSVPGTVTPPPVVQGITCTRFAGDQPPRQWTYVVTDVPVWGGVTPSGELPVQAVAVARGEDS